MLPYIDKIQHIYIRRYQNIKSISIYKIVMQKNKKFTGKKSRLYIKRFFRTKKSKKSSKNS